MCDAEPPLQYGGMPLFVAFQDGQFGYDCDRCVSLCCNEATGIVLVPDHVVCGGMDQFEPLVTGMRNGLLQVDIGLGGCPALTAAGRCALHTDGGPRHKPVTCALFPFNVLVRTQQLCAVAPHFSHPCPLVLDPPPGLSVSIRHEIADDLAHFLGSAFEPFELITAPRNNCVSIESEQRVLEAVNAPLGGRSLATALSEASGRPESELLRRAGEALELLSFDLALASPADVPSLLPMVPALRTSFYHLELAEIDAALLVGWQFVVAATGDGQAPGLRRIASVFDRFKRLVAMVVRAQRPVRLENPMRRPLRGIPEVALEVSLVLRDAQRDPGRHSLLELIARHVRVRGVQRSLVLNDLSRAGLVFE